MNRQWAECAVDWRVVITNEEYTHLEALDMDRLWDRGKEDIPTLYETIDRLEGVSDTNYNGHFGLFVFMKIEHGYNHAGTRALIVRAINEYLALEL